MGTWPTVTPEGYGPDTPYQKALPWMYMPTSRWPGKKEFTTPPSEECWKDVTQATCAKKEGLFYLAKATTRAMLI
jgi:hypothetical protein